MVLSDHNQKSEQVSRKTALAKGTTSPDRMSSRPLDLPDSPSPPLADLFAQR